jgi:hypothetical protein
VSKGEESDCKICAPGTAATDRSQVCGLSLSKRPRAYLLSLLAILVSRPIVSGLLRELLEIGDDVRPMKL